MDGPTLLVVLTDRRRVATNSTNMLPLEGVGTVYPIANVTDDWGILDVTGGGALVIYGPGGRVTQIYLAAPADTAARPLKGDGWTLAPGTRGRSRPQEN